MKAARNARFRLIPGNVRAQVIASARHGRTGREWSRRSPGASRRLARPLRRSRQRRQSGRSAAGRSHRLTAGELVTRVGPYAPTEKQVAFYQRLAESPVFTEEERRRALEWLATKATRQTIKDQIDWLKRQVETRKARTAGSRRP